MNSPSTRSGRWASNLRLVGRTVRAAIRPAPVLATVATATFPLAVLYPFFTLKPSLGDPLVDGVYDYADPGSMAPKTYSVLSGIATLFTDGDLVIAIVLLLFSVFFPAVKLALLWGVLAWPGPRSGRLVHGLETLGPWSMADVFIVSVMLLTFKSFPGGTTFVIEPGYYLFLSSVLTGLFATWIARRSKACDSITSIRYEV